jgi:hypothetical protein
VDLVVAEVREERGEHRWLRHVLAGMRCIAVLSSLRIADFVTRALVSATARAENAIGNVVGTVVTPHRLTPFLRIAGR